LRWRLGFFIIIGFLFYNYKIIYKGPLNIIRQENAVKEFRKICGPHDPDISKTIRKNTIRAKFGNNIAQNAVHCTDMEEDGILECEYFFKILRNS